MKKYFCLNCGKTTVYVETPFPNAKKWEVHKQYQVTRCIKCHSEKVYEYMSLFEYLLFKFTAWKEGWELYGLQNTYSVYKLEKMRRQYLAKKDLLKKAKIIGE